MRRVFILTLSFGLSGCTFATYARHTDFYPGTYDRALERAQLVSPDLVKQIEALGARTSYNGATHELLRCLDEYADGLRWRRQFEKRDLMSEESLTKAVMASRPHLRPTDDLISYEPDLYYVDSPEVAWENGMKACANICGDLAEGKAVGRPMQEDVELARKYVALCKDELAVVTARRSELKNAEKLAEARKALDDADNEGAKRAFLSMAFHMTTARQRLDALKNVGSDSAERARLASLREKYADGLEKVGAYQADPRLVELEQQRAALLTDLRLVSNAIDNATSAIDATAGGTTYDMVGGGVTHDRGHPEAHESFVERRRLLQQKERQLEAALDDVEALERALQTEYGIR